MQLTVGRFDTELDHALGLGAAALAAAESGRPTLLSAAFEAEALVLGALQRQDTLRQRSAADFGARVARRLTTGTEAQLQGKVLYHALALPRVDALYPDASARTLLNRNLRAILRGYAAAGVPFRYFGTEVLALLGHPVALVGYEQTDSGAVLIELLIGLENPCVVRSALKREAPAALYALLRSEPAPSELLRRAVAGMVERLGATTEELMELPPPLITLGIEPEGAPAAVSIPLGVVEAVLAPRVRVFGDLLVGTAALRQLEAAAQAAYDAAAPFTPELLTKLHGAPLDGAKPADLLQALEQARSA